jgi:tetratricopeptide (TPR) repeat protein
LGESDKTIPVISTAFLTSLLFGLHPIHVESVAWISERKDVLSGFFFLSGLLVYLPDPRHPWPEGRRRGVCLGLFILALLSKPMVVTFPLVLFLLDAWPLKRLFPLTKKIIGEKAPFFLLSLAVGIISIVAQSREGGIVTADASPLPLRVMNAFHSVAFYLWKMACPTNLCAFYPISPPGQLGFIAGAMGGVLILGWTGLICFSQRKEKPFLAVVWLYTVITLLPVLGFLQVGYQAAADRYTYLPSVALFLLVSAWAARLLSTKPFLLNLFSALLAAGLVWGSVNQALIWKDSISLWEDAVKLYPDSLLPNTYLARAYAVAGRWGDALQEYNRALTILPPGSPQVHHEMGKVLANMGRPDDAILQFNAAVSLDPGGEDALDCRRSLWMAFEKKGMHRDALPEIQEALKLDPHSGIDYLYLGITFWELGDLKNSEEALNQAYSIEPGNPEYLDTLASLYQKLVRLGEASDLFKKGIELHPNQTDFYMKLADLDMAQGLYSEAVDLLQRVESVQPQIPGLKEKLTKALEKANRK